MCKNTIPNCSVIERSCISINGSKKAQPQICIEEFWRIFWYFQTTAAQVSEKVGLKHVTTCSVTTSMSWVLEITKVGNQAASASPDIGLSPSIDESCGEIRIDVAEEADFSSKDETAHHSIGHIFCVWWNLKFQGFLELHFAWHLIDRLGWNDKICSPFSWVVLYERWGNLGRIFLNDETCKSGAEDRIKGQFSLWFLNDLKLRSENILMRISWAG